MSKIQYRNLYVALAVTALISCAVVMRLCYVPYSGVWRTLLYSVLIGAWGVSVWWRILQRQTRNCLLLSAALMLLWLNLRLIRFDFAATPAALRHLWYSYYVPMLLIPTLSVYALLFLDRSQTRPPFRYRVAIFAVPVALFTMVLTNDFHEMVFAFPLGYKILNDPDYTLPLRLLPMHGVDFILRPVYGRLSGAALPHPPHGVFSVAAAAAHCCGNCVRRFVYTAISVAAQDSGGHDGCAVPDLYGNV